MTTAEIIDRLDKATSLEELKALLKIFFEKQKSQTHTDRIIRRQEMSQIAGVSDVTLRRWEKKGIFPQSITLSGNASGWLESEVQAWLKEKADGRTVANA